MDQSTLNRVKRHLEIAAARIHHTNAKIQRAAHYMFKKWLSNNPHARKHLRAGSDQRAYCAAYMHHHAEDMAHELKEHAVHEHYLAAVNCARAGRSLMTGEGGKMPDAATYAKAISAYKAASKAPHMKGCTLVLGGAAEKRYSKVEANVATSAASTIGQHILNGVKAAGSAVANNAGKLGSAAMDYAKTNPMHAGAAVAVGAAGLAAAAYGAHKLLSKSKQPDNKTTPPAKPATPPKTNHPAETDPAPKPKPPSHVTARLEAYAGMNTDVGQTLTDHEELVIFHKQLANHICSDKLDTSVIAKHGCLCA